MKFVFVSLVLIAFISVLIYFAARDAFVPQPINVDEGAPTTQTPIQETASSSVATPQSKATSTFAPPPGTFRGPTGAPHINGPSGPPPNY